MAARFQLLGEPRRLRVVLACLGEPTRVSDIAERTGLSATLVSYHLRPLREAGILRSHRVGREVFYAAASARVPEAIRAMREVGVSQRP